MSKVADLTGLSRFWANVDKRKASIDGKYPDLMAGDLVGRGESVPAEFSFRASGGKSIKDGTAWIKRLKGNSVVWNQKVKGFASWNLQGGVIEGNEVVWSAESRTGALNAFSNTFAQHTTHKYLISADVKASSTNVGLGMYYTGFPLVHHSGSGQYERLAVITQGRGDGTDACYLTDTSTSGFGEIRAKNYKCTDLTQMFGAGNEPTTIEEFNARKPIVEDEYAYNEGEVIHMTAEGIKSVGDNAWDEEWRNGIYASSTGEYAYRANSICNANAFRILPNEEYWVNVNTEAYFFCYDEDMQFIKYLYAYQPSKILTPANAAYMNFYCSEAYGTTYNNDIMITLVHSGWKQDTDAGYQPYWEDKLIFDQRIKDGFPDGMSKWDMVYNKDGKGYIVKGTGVVDMGSLGGWYLGGGGTFWATGPALPTSRPANNDTVAQVVCKRYATANWSSVYQGVQGVIGLYTDGQIGFVDTAITSAEDIPTALAGVLLYYELAEPTIIEYDEPFNLDYKVADFGTEQAIVEQPSAPISADIIYQFNAVDMIREHEIEINELQSIIATMQAQLASLTSNNA